MIQCDITIQYCARSICRQIQAHPHPSRRDKLCARAWSCVALSTSSTIGRLSTIWTLCTIQRWDSVSVCASWLWANGPSWSFSFLDGHLSGLRKGHFSFRMATFLFFSSLFFSSLLFSFSLSSNTVTKTPPNLNASFNPLNLYKSVYVQRHAGPLEARTGSCGQMGHNRWNYQDLPMSVVPELIYNLGKFDAAVGRAQSASCSLWGCPFDLFSPAGMSSPRHAARSLPNFTASWC